MAYDEGLAQRVREALAGRSDVTEGMVYVGMEGIEQDGDLEDWLSMAVAFAGGLPPK